MLIGTDAETIATIMEPYDLLSLGFNCGSGPDEVMKHVKTLSENWIGRISVHSNAGLPVNHGGCTVYPMEPSEFSQLEKDFLPLFLDFLGEKTNPIWQEIETRFNHKLTKHQPT